MKTLPLSPAAAGLLRALIAHAGPARDRFLLTDVHSVDWQSLTFTGERHRLAIRIKADDADSLAERFIGGLEDAEFAIPGHIVADIRGELQPLAENGIAELTVEALTIEE